MVAGKGFEKSQEVEISIDDTSVGQTEKDLLTGFVIFCDYCTLHEVINSHKLSMFYLYSMDTK